MLMTTGGPLWGSVTCNLYKWFILPPPSQCDVVFECPYQTPLPLPMLMTTGGPAGGRATWTRTEPCSRIASLYRSSTSWCWKNLNLCYGTVTWKVLLNWPHSKFVQYWADSLPNLGIHITRRCASIALLLRNAPSFEQVSFHLHNWYQPLVSY